MSLVHPTTLTGRKGGLLVVLLVFLYGCVLSNASINAATTTTTFATTSTSTTDDFTTATTTTSSSSTSTSSFGVSDLLRLRRQTSRLSRGLLPHQFDASYYADPTHTQHDAVIVLKHRTIHTPSTVDVLGRTQAKETTTTTPTTTTTTPTTSSSTTDDDQTTSMKLQQHYQSLSTKKQLAFKHVPVVYQETHTQQPFHSTSITCKE